MRDRYNLTSERLWEKLEAYKDDFDYLNCVDWQQPFPIDQFAAKNPLVWKLIKEVDKEFNYGMSEFQCSWAINQFLRGGLEMMDKYNEVNGTSLRPRR